MSVDLPELVKLPFGTDKGYGARATVGLIVLETDHTIEVEMAASLALLDVPDVAVYHARIPMFHEVTPETLAAMEAKLPETAALLPNEFDFASIGYACTSASTVIGPDRVTAAIQTAHPETSCSNPLSAVMAALKAHGAKRVALITPYTADVTRPMAERLSEAGFTIGAMGSFLEANDHVVSRISPESIIEGVRRVAAEGDIDAAFISCTSLRTIDVIDKLEAELGIPVVSSNQALIWHLLRLAGVDDRIDGFGSLFSL